MTAAARYCRALGVLLRGAVLLLSACGWPAVVGNDALGARLDEATAAVARGDRVAESLRGALPPLAGSCWRPARRAAGWMRCAAGWPTPRRGRQRGLETLVRLLEPALIVVFGGVVGFIAPPCCRRYSVNAGLG